MTLVFFGSCIDLTYLEISSEIVVFDHNKSPSECNGILPFRRIEDHSSSWIVLGQYIRQMAVLQGRDFFAYSS